MKNMNETTSPLQSNFLKFVADKYAHDKNISNYCFVFPNRRSGKFFEKEIRQAANASMLSPEITTISNFVAEISNAVEANRIELLFILYNAYIEITGYDDVPFDKFAFWGDVIINDFSDTDRYMVNPKDLFINISQLKEIKANLKTPELMEVLGHFFNFNFTPDNEEKFWQHISTHNGEISKNKDFITIWDTLYQLYEKFIEKLNDKGLSYNGKMYHDAVNIIKQTPSDEFNAERYIFVGFNVLSESERQIFSAMKAKGIAEFYWDYNSPVFKTKHNKANLFLSKYVSDFKAPHNEPENTTLPQNINVIGVPSNYAQAQYTRQLIDHLVDKKLIANPADAIDTAIVLPDEQLFLPLIKSISNDKVTKINVTMGMSISNSSIATLMSYIATMHHQAKLINGSWVYFHADVKNILLHPIVRFYNNEESTKLITDISKQNLYQVSYDYIKEKAPSLAKLFTVIKDFSAGDIANYLSNIIEFTGNVLLLQKKANLESAQSKEEADSDIDMCTIEQAFLEKYREGIVQLQDVFSQYIDDTQFKVNIDTFCFLLNRLVSSTTIAFEGEPLGGLQIMGLLETRCLDFKNIIVLSMNENVFPRKHFTKSFVPQQLRKAYNMSTIEHQESMYAYYFYRMISRAENVYLIYNASSIHEESRFITQLEKLYSDICTLKRHTVNLELRASNSKAISVKKDQRILDKLKLYITGDIPESAEAAKEKRKKGEIKYLSASSIHTYINCPLAFYLHYVENLAKIDEVSDFMQANTFGTIVHSVMDQLYRNDSIIDKDFIDNLLKKENKTIKNAIIKTINKEYLKKGDDCYDELIGESLFKYKVFEKCIKDTLKYDLDFIKKHGPIHFLQSEKELFCKLNLGNQSVNFSYTIDRLEEIYHESTNPIVRIIDYKTGKIDKTSVAKLSDSFTKNESKAIVQLLLYSEAYLTAPNNENKLIQPLIIKPLDITKSGFKVSNQVVTFTKDCDIRKEFQELMGNVINSIFDENIPFTQTQDKNTNCKYCTFKDFCRIELQEYQK